MKTRLTSLTHTLALSASLALLSANAWADGLQALDAFLQNTRSGTADFEQTVIAPEKNGEPGRTTVSSGTFAFERPGKFRFDYRKPFPQLIVGDGKTLWVYDEDLEQATAREQTQTLDDTPAAIISSAHSRKDLEKNFTLRSVAANPHDGDKTLEWVEASPKATDGQVASLYLGFAQQQLVALDIKDNFGQLSKLRFNNTVANPTIDAAQFRFTPPEGTDIITHKP